RRLTQDIARFVHAPAVRGIVHVKERFALMREWVPGSTALDVMEDLRKRHLTEPPQLFAENDPLTQYLRLLESLFIQTAYTSAVGPLATALEPKPLGRDHYRLRLNTRVCAPLSNLFAAFGGSEITGSMIGVLQHATDGLSQLLSESPSVFYKDHWPNNIILDDIRNPQEFTNIDFASSYNRAPLGIITATLIAFGDRLTDPTTEQYLIRVSMQAYEEAREAFNRVSGEYNSDPNEFVLQEFKRDLSEGQNPAVSWVLQEYLSHSEKGIDASLKQVEEVAEAKGNLEALTYVHNLQYFLANLEKKSSPFNHVDDADAQAREERIFYAALVHRSLWMAGLHAPWVLSIQHKNPEVFAEKMRGIAGSLDTALYAAQRCETLVDPLARGIMSNGSDRYQTLRYAIGDLRTRFLGILDQLNLPPYGSVSGSKVASE
ncbi:MAG TPA: hypothetical protein VJK52_03655, partial [Candidatus Nanoarchaeia archaeon]|nr:hypothetical protein [Candidatus Nanoarchaeia archaeon]